MQVCSCYRHLLSENTLARCSSAAVGAAVLPGEVEFSEGAVASDGWGATNLSP